MSTPAAAAPPVAGSCGLCRSNPVGWEMVGQHDQDTAVGGRSTQVPIAGWFPASMIRCPSRPLGTAPSLASGRWHSWVTFRPRGLPIEGRPRDSGQCRCFRWPLPMAVTNGCYCRNDAESAEPVLFVSADCCAYRKNGRSSGREKGGKYVYI